MSALHADARALLDAIPDAAAVLDDGGTIVGVNRAWRMFALDNGGEPANTGVGRNYFEVCARSAESGCSDAVQVTDGLRAVQKGATVEYDMEYPCPSPTIGRWFVLRITRVAGSRPGLLVSHVNISRRKMAEADLQRKASHDPLTGLPNRTLFTERAASALTPRPGRAPGADVGLLFIDLDGFKQVNDTYGHAAGDEVLQNVAARFKDLARAQDTIARIGGDEFAIVAPRVTADGLASVVKRIEEAACKPHMIEGADVRVGASVGSYLAASGDDLTDSLGHADTAMYAAKRTQMRR